MIPYKLSLFNIDLIDWINDLITYQTKVLLNQGEANVFKVLSLSVLLIY